MSLAAAAATGYYQKGKEPPDFVNYSDQTIHPQSQRGSL